MNRSSSTSGNVDVVIVRSAVVENVGVAVGIMSMLVETEVISTSGKSSIFPWRVPLDFQVAPGNGKNYVHAENVKPFGIGPSRKRF